MIPSDHTTVEYSTHNGVPSHHEPFPGTPSNGPGLIPPAVTDVSGALTNLSTSTSAPAIFSGPDGYTELSAPAEKPVRSAKSGPTTKPKTTAAAVNKVPTTTTSTSSTVVSEEGLISVTTTTTNAQGVSMMITTTTTPSGKVVRVVKKRNTANKKERRRTQSINNAFAELRECIPNVPSDTKLSKIKTLRLATSYIAYLMDLISASDDASVRPVEFTVKPRFTYSIGQKW
jgi:hypothetical protein